MSTATELKPHLTHFSQDCLENFNNHQQAFIAMSNECARVTSLCGEAKDSLQLRSNFCSTVPVSEAELSAQRVDNAGLLSHIPFNIGQTKSSDSSTATNLIEEVNLLIEEILSQLSHIDGNMNLASNARGLEKEIAHGTTEKQLIVALQAKYAYMLVKLAFYKNQLERRRGDLEDLDSNFGNLKGLSSFNNYSMRYPYARVPSEEETKIDSFFASLGLSITIETGEQYTQRIGKYQISHIIQERDDLKTKLSEQEQQAKALRLDLENQLAQKEDKIRELTQQLESMGFDREKKSE